MRAGPLLGAGLLLLLGGCASLPPFSVVRGEIQLHPDRGRLIEGVPSFPLPRRMCGPSAALSLLAYWKHPSTPTEAVEALYRPYLRGTVTLDFLIYLRDHQFHAEVLDGGLPAILGEIRQGRPAPALLDVGPWPIEVDHYVVVVGYDEPRRVVVALWGEPEPRVIGMEEFERRWRRAGSWALTVRPRGNALP